MAKTKVKQLTVHPRYECSTNCKNCYLLKDMVGNGTKVTTNKGETKPHHVMEAYMDRLLALAEKKGYYDEIQLSFMLNNTNYGFEVKDLAMMATLTNMYNVLRLNKILDPINDISVYTNHAMIANKKNHGTVMQLIETMDYMKECNMSKENGYKIWVSDLLNNDMSTATDELNVLKKMAKRGYLNVTMTLDRAQGLTGFRERTIGRLNKFHDFMVSQKREKDYCVYINVMDDDGDLSPFDLKGANETFMKIALDTELPVEFDSCVLTDFSNVIPDIEHIFPNGSVRNCPYIPYTRNMNNILKEDYCLTNCPHKRSKDVDDKKNEEKEHAHTTSSRNT